MKMIDIQSVKDILREFIAHYEEDLEEGDYEKIYQDCDEFQEEILALLSLAQAGIIIPDVYTTIDAELYLKRTELASTIAPLSRFYSTMQELYVLRSKHSFHSILRGNFLHKDSDFKGSVRNEYGIIIFTSREDALKFKKDHNLNAEYCVSGLANGSDYMVFPYMIKKIGSYKDISIYQS